METLPKIVLTKELSRKRQFVAPNANFCADDEKVPKPQTNYLLPNVSVYGSECSAPTKMSSEIVLNPDSKNFPVKIKQVAENCLNENFIKNEKFSPSLRQHCFYLNALIAVKACPAPCYKRRK